MPSERSSLRSITHTFANKRILNRVPSNNSLAVGRVLSPLNLVFRLVSGCRGNEVGVSVSLGFVFQEMGVRGLTSYIESIGNLGKQIELLDTKLIIDGDNLCNHLYRENGFDYQCGGQYEEFYSKIVLFFDALDSKGVESFVVLDGAYDKSDKRLETKKKRAQDRIETSERLFKNERSPDANSNNFVTN